MRMFGIKSILVFVMVLFHVWAVEAAEYGKFVGKLVTEALDDGRKLRLVAPFTFIDVRNLKWFVPKDTVTDGASVPRFAWAAFPPFSGKYRKAAVVHDRFCQTRDRSWRAVHRMFYEAMLAADVSALSARIMYGAVYAFGPRWSNLGGGDTRAAIIMPKLSNAEQETAFRDLRAWIEKENPTPEDIERRVNKLRIR